MARIKYILNERRIAATEAQDLIRQASEGGEGADGSERAPASFMEEDVPSAQPTQASV